ncbi:MAG: hypothetical protein L6W00_12185 [Lentisphaeria bacterium]|nr:MAG: hypothetical protein L6W00_12185 [Lentisphaeria bacterium]
MIFDLLEWRGYVNRNGRRYSLVALAALLRVVCGNPEQLTSRTRCIYRYRHRKA